MPILDNRPSAGSGGAVESVNGQTGDVTLVKADIGLGNVDNTSDANKPISTAQQTAIDTVAETAGEQLEEVCNDNTTTVITIGETIDSEVYEIVFALVLAVSGKKIMGQITLGYDIDEGEVIFDEERIYFGDDLEGVEFEASENLGDLNLEVALTAVGENATLRYTVRKIGPIT